MRLLFFYEYTELRAGLAVSAHVAPLLQTNDSGSRHAARCVCGPYCVPEACFCGHQHFDRLNQSEEIAAAEYEHARFSAGHRPERYHVSLTANKSGSTCVMCRNGWYLLRGKCVTSAACLAKTGMCRLETVSVTVRHTLALLACFCSLDCCR